MKGNGKVVSAGIFLLAAGLTFYDSALAARIAADYPESNLKHQTDLVSNVIRTDTFSLESIEFPDKPCAESRAII